MKNSLFKLKSNEWELITKTRGKRKEGVLSFGGYSKWADGKFLPSPWSDELSISAENEKAEDG